MGEEEARGPTVPALYQARLRTVLFSLRGCFAFWPPSWGWAGGMDQNGARWKDARWKVVSRTQAVTMEAAYEPLDSGKWTAAGDEWDLRGGQL